MRHALVLGCSIALLGSIGPASAQDWTKSKWGPDDEIGAANYMKPELVLKAASLIKTGKTYGLGHIGVDHVYYNGNKLLDFADPTGLKKLGVEKVPPMVTRGVLLDMAAHYNTDVVKEGTAFNVKEIEEVAKKQGVEIRQGDVVIFHTGWLSLIGKDDKRYSTGEPGVESA